MTTLRTRVIRGLISGLLHEAVAAILSFAAMIVLVRLLTPQEYGQAAAVTGLLALIGAFRGAMFVEHALQYSKEHEPDWDTYSALVGIAQILLFGVTLAVAFVCNLAATFAPLSPLLLVASVGFLLDWPSQVASVKLRRELRFEHLKIVSSAALALRLASAVVLAWLGFGAMALIISANVLSAAPLALSFLLVERWRPRRGWLFIPPAVDVKPALQFGVQQIAVGFVQTLRTAVESVVLTAVFGIATFGLINRALALYQSTIGRLGLVFVETAYPLLPMERTDATRYAYRASRFIEASLILSIPGAAFLALEGASVSRLLYGGKWIEADPFLAPAATALAAAALVSAAAYVIQGVGHVRTAALIEALAAIGGLVALSATLLVEAATPYIWALAASQIAAAIVAFLFAARFLEPDWRRKGLWPALTATVAGAGGLTLIRWWLDVDGGVALMLSAVVYAAVVVLVLAFTARPVMLEVMRTHKAFTWKVPRVRPSQARA